MKSRKRLEEQLILHLSRFFSFRERFALPFEITQDGIAKELGVLRNHVPALVKPLEEEGLIYEKKARVVGAKNRRKTYFLTEKGMEAARKISEKRQNREKNRHMPRGGEFFGRAAELQEMKRWWRSSRPILLITGMEGIGKSSLVAEFTKDMDNLFWYSINEDTTPESLFKEMKLHLSWQMNSIHGVMEKMEEGGLYLSKAVSNYLIVLDGLQNASERLMDFIRTLMEAVKESDGGRMILISSFVPDGMESVRTMRIGPLDRDSFIELAKKRNFRDPDRLYEMSGGNPAALLLPDMGAGKGDYFKALVSLYSESELSIMETGALYDEPMDVSSFLLERNAGYESFLVLLKKGALERYEGDRYAVSSVIKDMLRKRMPEDRKVELWKKIGEHLGERGDIHLRILGAVYLMKAGRYAEARDLIVEVGKAAITGGYDEELWSAIGMLPERYRNGDIVYLQGNLYEVTSQWKDALRTYGRAEEMFRSNKSMRKMAESIRKQGSVLRMMGRLDEAMDRYSIALRISRSRELRTKIYDNMGTLELIRGNLEKGREYIEKAMEYAKKTGDEELVGLEYNSMGNVFLSMGLWKEAEKAYMNAMERLDRVENRRMLAIALNNIAIAYYKQLKLRKASLYWKRSADISKELGDISYIYSEVNRASAALKTGDFEGAEESAAEILSTLSMVEGYSRVKSASLSIRGHVEKIRGNLTAAMEYYREALKERESNKDRKSAISSTLDMAEVMMIEGEMENARRLVKKSIESAREGGFKEEFVEGNLLLASLRYRKGERRGAEETISGLIERKDYGNRELEGRVFMEAGRIYAKKDGALSIRYLKKAKKLLRPVFVEENVSKILLEMVMDTDSKDHGGEEARKILREKGVANEIIDFLTYI